MIYLLGLHILLVMYFYIINHFISELLRNVFNIYTLGLHSNLAKVTSYSHCDRGFLVLILRVSFSN